MKQTFQLGLLTALRKARSITVLTGAGISAESGVPTFRDAQTGLWANFKPEELATAEAFLSNPKMVWEWYQYRFDIVRTVQPNPGHYALAEMERRVTQFTLVTQNIDGLHQKAGSRNVQELHGNIQRYKCVEDNQVVESWVPTQEMPPKCPRCGGMIRPDIVWFGESLPDGPYEAAHNASITCDVFFSIGTSAAVFPAAALPGMALKVGAVVVEINPERTPVTPRASYIFQMPSGQLLPDLVKAAWG